MNPRTVQGVLDRISGPICQASGLGACGLFDVVQVGRRRLIGEVIRLKGESATVQVYEDNTGMEVGEPITSLGEPLTVELGPGLMGEIYDGIQRPLRQLYASEGCFLQAGSQRPPLDRRRRWSFVPVLRPPCPLHPGQILGTVQESPVVEHRILVPPLTRGRRLESLAPAGEYTLDDVLGLTDQNEPLGLSQRWPVRTPRPYIEKLPVREPLITGLRVIDVLFPLARGGTAAMPGGFGTGKTMAQQAIAKWCDADIIVYIGCGERGNEMTEVLTDLPTLVDPRTGHSLLERTILIANTSNMPVAAREVSIYTGVTLAEYYRDMGYHVAILADSTSRWAEALRELSGRLEEMPAEEGFPAYLPTRLAEFYERGGLVSTLAQGLGSLSIIGAISPPGGDFSEPVTQHTKRFIRAFWALDRELANARHYPAIGWIDSYSDYGRELEPWWRQVNPDWAIVRAAAVELLKREQRLQQIARLVGPDALAAEQRLVLIGAEMIKNGFLQQNSHDPVDMFCVPEKQIAILGLLLRFHRRATELVNVGAPLARILGLPVREALVRLKSSVPNTDLSELTAVGDRLEREADQLEREVRERGGAG